MVQDGPQARRQDNSALRTDSHRRNSPHGTNLQVTLGTQLGNSKVAETVNICPAMVL